VRPSRLGTPATIGSTAPAPDDDAVGGIRNGRGNRSNRRKLVLFTQDNLSSNLRRMPAISTDAFSGVPKFLHKNARGTSKRPPFVLI
jgi:hypothetical protein